MVIRVEQGKGQKDRLWAAAHMESVFSFSDAANHVQVKPNFCLAAAAQEECDRKRAITALKRLGYRVTVDRVA